MTGGAAPVGPAFYRVERSNYMANFRKRKKKINREMRDIAKRLRSDAGKLGEHEQACLENRWESLFEEKNHLRADRILAQVLGTCKRVEKMERAGRATKYSLRRAIRGEHKKRNEKN